MPALPTLWLPWLLNAILALMAAEALWLLLYRRPAQPQRLRSVLAGAGLVLAWRLHLAGAAPWVVAACLGAAGLAHARAWWWR